MSDNNAASEKENMSHRNETESKEGSGIVSGHNARIPTNFNM